MNAVDFYQRRAGVLLHPTSLPSGLLDADVERWIDLLAQAGFSAWQMLPLGEPQAGLSPYQCISAFALNPALLASYPHVDSSDHAFVQYCDQQEWLDDYVLFKVLKNKFQNTPWYEWPEEYKHRHSHAMLQTADEYADQLAHLRWQQYQLHARWHYIRDYAERNKVLLFGDVPLFIAHDSVDVWAAPERFLLDKTGRMEVVTGVPPDYYSETGQRWGNPHYDWEFMRTEDYAWWLERIRQHLELFHIVRIDHFRGLESAWVIKASCKTAIEGRWVKMPGDELLSRIRQEIGSLPIVAEDLGIITEAVRALRTRHHLPGMAVLQFGFDEHEDNPHKPHNITEDCVVYTGTHDNDTTLGWLRALDEPARKHVYNSLGCSAQSEQPDILNKLIESAMHSRASLCIIPMQDVLGLDTSARMNTPGTTAGNWTWSFEWEQIDANMTGSMRMLISGSNRLVEQNV